MKKTGAQKRAHKKWVKSLPRSKMVYPKQTDKKLKYAFWRVFTPVHPIVRGLAVPVRKMKGLAKRQPYLIGTISAERSIESLVKHLVANGYHLHPVAWNDPGELVSMRRVVGFDWQYHLRIFEDGEVRGHYELTPESYPFKHLKTEKQEDRYDEFAALLEGFIVPHRKKKKEEKEVAPAL